MRRVLRDRFTSTPVAVRASLGAAFVLCALLTPEVPALAHVVDPPMATPGVEHWIGAVVGLAAVAILAIVIIQARLRRDNRRRLRTLADAAIEGILIVNDGIVVDVNPGFLRMSGHDQDDVVGRVVTNGLFRGYALDDRSGSLGEYELFRRDGTVVSVEIIRRIDEKRPGHRILAIRDLTERKAAQARLEYIAHHDMLTGLKNRQSLQEHIAALTTGDAAASRPFALLSIDLDRFKEINDVFGQHAGDRLLVGYAWGLSMTLGETDALFRFAGDQFIVVTTGTRDAAAGTSESLRQHADALAHRLSQCLNTPVDTGPRMLRCGGSIGVAVFPQDTTVPDELIAKADIAMLRAKRDTGRKVCFFTAEMDSDTRASHALAQDMNDALARGEFEIHYQVQADVATGLVTGMEALLRWNHPVHGSVSPGVFIPIAERTGFIVELGEWVLRQACRTAAGWDKKIRLAVNLSPVQFRQTDLPRIVQEILLETGLPARRLELEITESVLMGDPERALLTLRQLKVLGVSIALDDFGTGFSSLSMLRDFPFDKLKIDRSFISEIDETKGEAKLLSAIFSLARSLDLAVLAEGIETQAQFQYLIKGGCDEAQGYLLQRPKRIEDLLGFVVAGANVSIAQPAAKPSHDGTHERSADVIAA